MNFIDNTISILSDLRDGFLKMSEVNKHQATLNRRLAEQYQQNAEIEQRQAECDDEQAELNERQAKLVVLLIRELSRFKNNSDFTKGGVK